MPLTRGQALGWFAGTAAALIALAPGCRAAPRCEATSGGEAEGCFQPCLAGKSAACRTLATMHSAGMGAGPSKPVASMYLERACQLGDADSCGRLPPAAPSASAPLAAVSCALPAPPHRPLEGRAAQLAAQCEAGRGASCIDLAALAEEGAGTPQDPAFATAQLVRSCQLHVPKGCRLAGWALLRGAPSQTAEAEKMLVAGCMASDMPSCAALGEINLRRPEPGLAQRGYGQIQSSCQGADPVACRRQARLLREGVVVARNDESADRLIDRSIALADNACVQADRESCARLGVWREFPGSIEDPEGPRTGDQGSLDAAAAAYTKACEGGLTVGCARLADELKARGNEERATEVERQLAAACQAGDVTSCSGLVRPPFRVGERPAEQRATLVKACELAVGAACTALATVDTAGAGPLLERACGLGDRAGCERLVERAGRDPQAERRRACDQGASESCARLALDHLRTSPAPDKACLQALLDRSCRPGEASSARACGWAAEVARSLDTEAARALLPSLEDEGCRLASASRPPDLPAAQACLGRGQRAGLPPEEAQRAVEESCRLGSGAGCLALARILEKKGAALPARERFTEACRRGERAGCEQAFGPLPAASALARGAL
jgi:TPR repeat protein